MNTQQLINQLKDMGITRAVSSKGMSEGYPAIFLRWNGDSEVFTGCDRNNPDDVQAAQVARFKDSKLA